MSTKRVIHIYKNKHKTRNNIAGEKIATIRKSISPKLSQRALADALQLQGIDLDKNAIQRMESGQRFITDIELLALSRVLNTDVNELLS